MEEQDEDLWSSSLDDRNSEGMFVEGGVIATLYSEVNVNYIIHISGVLGIILGT